MTRGGMTSRAAVASVAVALFLLVIKGFAAAETGSIAMLGSLADTALDLAASLVTLFSVRYAATPADDDHRFGHGKAEALSALFQVVLISVSALAIGWRATERLIGGTAQTQAPEYGIGVSVIAMIVTLGLLAYQRRVIASTGSVAIHADHVHYQSDLLLNGAVIAALLLDSLLSLRGADAVFGILIAFWLLWGAWQSASNAVDQLLDKEWPLERKQRLVEIVTGHNDVKGIHDIRTRSSGSADFCQFHIWLDPEMPIIQAHEVMDEVEDALNFEFPDVEFLIHPDPEGHHDEIDYTPSETLH